MSDKTHCVGKDGVGALCNKRIFNGIVDDPRLVTCAQCVRALCSHVQFYNALLTEAKRAATK